MSQLAIGALDEIDDFLPESIYAKNTITQRCIKR
jgi:hypothetical protein